MKKDLNDVMITIFGFDPGLPLKPGKNPWPWKSPKHKIRIGGDMMRRPFEPNEAQTITQFNNASITDTVIITPGQFINGHQFNESGVYTVRNYPSDWVMIQKEDLSGAKRVYVTTEFEIVVDIA